MGRKLYEYFYCVDFNDSFFFNIIRLYYPLFSRISEKVILLSHEDFLLEAKNILKDKTKREKKIGLLWGPGPGSPNSSSLHRKLSLILTDLLKLPLIRYLGICLGHQYRCFIEVPQSLKRVNFVSHGTPIEIELPSWPFIPKKRHFQKIEVIRYNSLCIKKDYKSFFKIESEFLYHQEELMMAYSCTPQGYKSLTFQFHPESLGCSDPRAFLEIVKQFLEN